MASTKAQNIFSELKNIFDTLNNYPHARLVLQKYDVTMDSRTF